jgi:acetylornithine deacetylase/succinyl-diaminopimelate desuccinylase-like protein
MSLSVQQTLAELVAIPSINPMGRPIEGDQFLEYKVTEYLERMFQLLELPYQRQEVEPRRANIVARLDGTTPPDEGGQLLMFEAHQDTVPIDGMTIDPFAAEVRDGRLYGRGACDIKGGMTAMLVALSRLVEDRPADMPTIMMACTINEEHGYSGASDLTELWADGVDSIFPRCPDAAIVAEPTSLDVVVAHKGAMRWPIQTRGRAGHSSRPDEGVNAIYRMARVLQVLERYQAEVTPTLGTHPRCGGVTLSVGTISGGISVNTVPDECSIEIDRRTLPGEDGPAARDAIIEYIRSAPEIDFEVNHGEPSPRMGGSLTDEHNMALGERLRDVARETLGRGELIGVPYGTDAIAISAAGVPTVVFGPGSIDQAHTADEWVELAQIERASEVLYNIACGGL